ncbi:hypothetical protein NC651_027927 [Populus alba x Populus x berolinensis]|nr:hypothetical protein NC651_027927 [Populus alba x Populus x berolinensis]
MKTGHVTGLDLACSMLYGTLHFNSTLFSLHHLQKIDLSDNDFNFSHISSRFGHFSNLTLLNLNYSIFAGQVSSEITHLSKLVSLDLSENDYLSLEPSSLVEISSSICELRFLQVLNLSNNSFSGSMPLCLGNFSNMLLVLHLGTNNLQGTIPLTFSNDNSLEYLNLNGNELEGKISQSIINCTMLEFLHLGNNKIEDPFPCFMKRFHS